jgi:hypothetical protein
MTPYTKDYTLVQGKNIIHGDLAGVGLYLRITYG